jgi:hypothetical protein
MSETTWYIRARGRITGPFSVKQLEALRKRGQLARFHELSEDRQSWSSAALLPGLFPEPPMPGGQAASAIGVDANNEAYEINLDQQIDELAPDQEQWFYMRDGATVGPVSLLALQEMASRSEIRPDCFVWKEGMPTWVNCRQVPQVVFPTILPAAAPRKEVAPFIDLREDELSIHEGPRRSYVSQGYGESPRVSGLAVASLVLGLLTLCGVGSLLATIFGAVALSQISNSKGRLLGKGMAIAGLVLGIIELTIGLIWYMLFVSAYRA